MPIVLSRVDDRLVHGQVVIGWGRPLGVEFIVLVRHAVPPRSAQYKVAAAANVTCQADDDKGSGEVQAK